MARKITPTHVLLNQIELSSNSSSVTFSAIPQGYGDLVVIYDGQTVDSGNYDIRLSFNGSTSDFSFVAMGAETSPFSYTAGTINTINPGTGNKTVATFNIMDYSATDKHKTSLIRVSAASRTVAAGVQRWATTDAITSVTLAFLVGNYVAGSTFSLYGVYA